MMCPKGASWPRRPSGSTGAAEPFRLTLAVPICVDVARPPGGESAGWREILSWPQEQLKAPRWYQQDPAGPAGSC